MARKSPYRSFPLHLTKDEGFRELSLKAKGLLLTLALHCDLTGLVRFSPGVLAIEANAASQDELSKLLEELETAGWIVADGNAVFVPALLGWSYNYSPANENHRPGVENSVQKIRSPKLIDAFWSTYPEWRDGVASDAPRSRQRIDRDPDAMRDGIGMVSVAYRNGTDIPSLSDHDPEATARTNTNTKTNNSTETPPTALEFARALASQLKAAQAQNPSITANLKAVKADAAAAAELQREGVPLTFALQVTADIGINFAPDSAAPQISSTRYVNKAIIERWSLTGVGQRVLPLRGIQNRRGLRDESRSMEDQAKNRNPEVMAAVKAYMAKLDADLPGAGERWLDDMKARKPADRYLYPFAFESIKTTTAATIVDHEARRS